MRTRKKNPKLLFQSTPSVGRATTKWSIAQKNGRISIHALRGEGDIVADSAEPKSITISIHALRGEGDVIVWVVPLPRAEISIHALRGEGDN